jgi:uncharacterized membrane protein
MARPGWAGRSLAALLAIATFFLVAVVSYLTWTPVGAARIEGFQGRYFLPLIVPWVVLLQWPSWVERKLGQRTRWVVSIVCLAYVELFLVHAFRVMHVRYWA